MTVRIPLRDEPIVFDFDQPVTNQLPVEHDLYDFPNPNGAGITTLDAHDIAGAQRWQHTAAGNTELDIAKIAGYFGCEFRFDRG